jgi:gamma-glutamylcyclotransferase (GGCT)/AIG2-like uncharacterized protein YtfP
MKTEDGERLFCYGTLKNAETQQRVFGRILVSTPRSLRGYALERIEVSDPSFLARDSANQMTLVPCAGGQIDGLVLTLNAEDLLVADRYEPAGYQRIAVETTLGERVWVYLALAADQSVAQTR